jgi:hypothetical protein
VRFPAAAGAAVTWFVWNLFLAPAIYKFGMTTAKAKADFVQWLVSPFLIQVHILNLPAAMLVFSTGGPAGGVRLFTPSDFWIGMVDVCLYSAVYLFILDRAGVHLYPAFSPRSRFSFVGYSALLGLYYGCFCGWNALIERVTELELAP